MAVQVGRTQGKWIKVQIDDSGGVVRDIPVTTINGVGITAPYVDLTALQDTIQGGFVGQGQMEITIEGPFDTTAAVTASVTAEAAAISGSHIVLSGINNGVTPLTFGVYYGMRQVWIAGEPSFGLTSSATVGMLCRDYTVNSNGTYSAIIYMFPGSTTPAWGTAAFT